MIGSVYFLRPEGERGPIKIGYSASPVERLRPSNTKVEIAPDWPASPACDDLNSVHTHFPTLKGARHHVC